MYETLNPFKRRLNSVRKPDLKSRNQSNGCTKISSRPGGVKDMIINRRLKENLPKITERKITTTQSNHANNIYSNLHTPSLSIRIN